MYSNQPIQHSMTHRSAAHDYTRPGLYHITMHVAEGLGQVLGAIVGDLSALDGSPETPHTALSSAGAMVEYELQHSIREHYPMVVIDSYVIMPEHLHFIMEVQDRIVSHNGKVQPLGQVIAGFKKGCNKRFWEMMGKGGQAAFQTGGQAAFQTGGQTAFHTHQEGTAGSLAAGSLAAGSLAAGSLATGSLAAGSLAASVSGGFPARYKVPSSGTTGRQPLFDYGYCDVMPVDKAQLETQRAYIAGNPRSRLMRMSNRALLTVSRGSFRTALTFSALRGYLQRECAPSQATTEALAEIQHRLLSADGFILCDTFGSRSLLTDRRCLPVICHRKDALRFAEHKARCLKEAAQGAVLVSACISPREREIIKENMDHGFHVATIHDNGFPDRYHPSAEHQELCTAGRLLIVSPWGYQYRGKNEQITVPYCKTMNCVAQAICREKDSWWKQ